MEIGRNYSLVNDATVRGQTGGANEAEEVAAGADRTAGTTGASSELGTSAAKGTAADSLSKFVAMHGLHAYASQPAAGATATRSASSADATARSSAAAQRPDAPERTPAQEQLANLSANLELPVLARLDAAMGKSWDLFNDTARDSEGAVLMQRLQAYGMTRADLQRYVLTGQEPAGLKRALADAQRRGEWPALGVVRAAYTMRADYLRATTAPDDTASRGLAAQLDSTAQQLSQNRAAIHMAWGTRTAASILRDKPDPATRSKEEQRLLNEAKQAISSEVRHAVEQLEKNPTRYGKDGATRTLAAYGLATEANIAQTEARAAMDREGKKLADETASKNSGSKPGQPKIGAPPPTLHPDLAEGGLVDRKRAEALKIDPRLGDVVHGGERAINFTRDGLATKKLRLANEQQQVAHAESLHQRAPDKVARPPAEQVAKVNADTEQLYRTTLETHQKLASEKPGSLTLEQTRLLGELGSDALVLASSISDVQNRKQILATMKAQVHERKLAAQEAREKVVQQLKDLDQAKVKRLHDEYHPTGSRFGGRAEYERQRRMYDPIVQPDSAEEKAQRDVLMRTLYNLDTVLPGLEAYDAAAGADVDYSLRWS